MAHVRFAARDPGGANVIAGFLGRCGVDLPFTFDVWTLPRATAIFRRGGLDTREFREDFDLADVAEAWTVAPADALVTGTSHYAAFEPGLWELARRDRCPSLALNDAWANLSERFGAGRPDHVGAVDATQARDLALLGFPPERIIVTGHPWLSPLIERRDELIATTDVPGDGGGTRVLFVSECVASDVARGVQAAFGFDEFDAFELVYRAAAVAARGDRPVRLMVKCHPYEDVEAFRQRLEGYPPQPGLAVHVLGGEEQPYRWVLWSDVVTGMTSTLLLEAIVLGRPVLSVQPGLARDNGFIAGRLGFAPTLTDPAEAERVLAEVIRRPAARAALVERHRPFIETIPADSITPVMTWIRAHTGR